MTTTVVDMQEHDQALVSALETLNRPVGYSEAPEGALEAVKNLTGQDYVILYPISGERQATSAKDSVGDAVLVYQTTIVGRSAAGVRWLIDKVETALAGVSIPNRAVIRLTPDRVGDVRPGEHRTVNDTPVFLATPTWRLWTSPA